MYELRSLQTHCTIAPDRWERRTYGLTFCFPDEVKTTIGIGFDDEQSGAQLVIKHMTTWPLPAQRKGFGRRALAMLLAWATTQGITDIQAVQVQRSAELFWNKCGFKKLHNKTNDFSYLP